MNDEATAPAKPAPKLVYAITERHGVDSSGSVYTRIGTAWTNRDGSLTIRLDAIPINGVMMVRDAPPEGVLR